MLAVPLRWEESGCSDLAGAAMGKIMEGNRWRSLLYTVARATDKVQGNQQGAGQHPLFSFLFSSTLFADNVRTFTGNVRTK